MMELPLRNDLKHYVLKLQEPQDCSPQCHHALLSTSISIAVFIIHIKEEKPGLVSTLLKYADTSYAK